MNSWITEKALGIAEATVLLLPLLERATGTLPTGESEREVMGSHLGRAYSMACLFIAYASGGFPDDLIVKSQEAFRAGPEDMRVFARSLAAEPPPGMEPPQPGLPLPCCAYCRGFAQ